MAAFDYINRAYGLSLKRGTRCVYTGGDLTRQGIVTSCDGSHIRVRFDDAPHTVCGPFHPTWEMQYPPPPPRDGETG